MTLTQHFSITQPLSSPIPFFFLLKSVISISLNDSNMIYNSQSYILSFDSLRLTAALLVFSLLFLSVLI